MKAVSKIISIYFLFLIVFPTMIVVKTQFGCASSCGKEISNKTTKKEGCSKGRCILNLSFNPSQFIVQHIHYIEFNKNFEINKEDNLGYYGVFIQNFSSKIWHPPKNTIFV